MHARAAPLDRQAHYPPLEHVPGRRGERLPTHEDVGWRDRDHRRSSALGHHHDLDTADAHGLDAIPRRQLDAKQILRRDGGQAAVGERADVVGPAVGVFELVRDDAHRKRTSGALGRERAVERARGGGVRRARGLIEQQHVRSQGERARDGDPLNLPFGQFVAAAAEQRPETQPIHDVPDDSIHR